MTPELSISLNTLPSLVHDVIFDYLNFEEAVNLRLASKDVRRRSRDAMVKKISNEQISIQKWGKVSTFDEGLSLISAYRVTVANFEGLRLYCPNTLEVVARRFFSQNRWELLGQSTFIQELKLNTQHMTALRFASLRGLTKLRTLDFNVHGVLGERLRHIGDASIAHLRGHTNLEKLCLFGSKVTNAGLAMLAGLTKLTSLNLSTCIPLTDDAMLTIGKFTDLECLDLSNCNRLTGTGFAGLSGLKNLKRLHLNNCSNLIGENLSRLDNLRSLEFLDLTSSNLIFDEDIVYLSGLINIRTLILNCPYNLTSAALIHLQGLTLLRRLSLRGWNHGWVEDDFARLKKLTALEYLDLTNRDNVVNAHLVHLSGFTNLTTLFLPQAGSLNRRSLAFLGEFTKLEHLTLNNLNSKKSSNKNVFLYLTKNLKTLNLHGSYLNSDEYRCLGTFTNLRSLVLSGTHMISENLAQLTALTNLESIDLGLCPEMTGEALTHLKGFTLLRSLLYPHNKKLKDTDLTSISGLTNLQFLDFRCCTGLTEDFLDYLAPLKGLKTLYLSVQLSNQSKKQMLERGIDAKSY